MAVVFGLIYINFNLRLYNLYNLIKKNLSAETLILTLHYKKEKTTYCPL